MDITLDWSLPGLASIVRIFTNLYPNPKQVSSSHVYAKFNSQNISSAFSFEGKNLGP